MHRAQAPETAPLPTQHDVQARLELGEDSCHRFLSGCEDVGSLAAEVAAMANTAGGCLYLGIGPDGQLSGLGRQDIARLNRLLAAAGQSLTPPVPVVSRNVAMPDHKVVIVVAIPRLVSPCQDSSGICWVKNAAGRCALQQPDPGAGALPDDVAGELSEQPLDERSQAAVPSGTDDPAKPLLAQRPLPGADPLSGAGQGDRKPDEEPQAQAPVLPDPASSEAREARDIYRLIARNTTITTNELADRLGVCKRTVLKRVALLKELGAVLRHGSSRGGFWEAVPEKAAATILAGAEAVDEPAKIG